MNFVLLLGRLTRDPEMRYIPETEKAVASFAIAVDRPFAKDKADFINIVVFGKPAENCEKYLAKGRMVAVQGRLQIDNYTDKNGEKKYKTEVIADRVQFLEWGDKKQAADDDESVLPKMPKVPEGFQVLDDDDEIPF